MTESSARTRVDPVLAITGKRVLSRELKGVTVEGMVGGMSKRRHAPAPPPDIPGRPKDWREQIKADLAAQIEAGGTLYGVRSDGAYIARTKQGDRVLKRPGHDSA